MTIRTFWTIFIKMLGIWLVLDSVTVIPQFLSALPFFGSNHDENVIGLTVVLGLLLLTIGVYFLILRFFVFKTAWIIDQLHLDKGFDEEKIDFNVQLSTVITICTIIIGGLIFIDSVPQLCKQIFVFFQQKSIFRESPTSGWIFFYLAKTALGYSIMTNSELILAFFQKEIAKKNDRSE